MRFARAYLVTMRPYLLFVSGITGVLGLALGPGRGIGATLAMAAAFFLSYGFGQALTDCFQLDTDSLSSPYRPMVQGLIRRRDVALVSLVGLAACGVVLTAAAPVNLWPALAAVAGVATYTPFKRRWWGGPWYNAWIVVLLVVMGYLGASGTWRTPGQVPVFGTALALTFFAYANFVLAGYFKDTAADRATGYQTVPVRFGFPVACLASDLLAALSVAAAAGIVAAKPAVPAVVFLLAGTAALAWAQFQLHQVRADADAHSAIAPVVHGYLLLHGAAVAAVRPQWAMAAVTIYAAFVWALSRRPMEQQI